MGIQVRVLIDDRSWPIAKLIPDQEVEIFSTIMREKLEESGISTDKAFATEHHIKNIGWKVYPKDGKAVFAKAFEQFYFIHGLQQQGYKWKDGEEGLARLKLLELEGLSDIELAKKIVEIHITYGNSWT